MPLESKVVAIRVNRARVFISLLFLFLFFVCGKGRHNFLGESNKERKKEEQQQQNNGRMKKEPKS